MKKYKRRHQLSVHDAFLEKKSILQVRSIKND